MNYKNGKYIAMVLATMVLAFTFATAATAADTASTTPDASMSTSSLAITTSTRETPATTPLTDVSTSTPSKDSQVASSTSTLAPDPSNIATSSSSDLSVKKTTEQLSCLSAYTADLFNTRSGHAAARAVKIGTQSWVDCTDAQGHKFEFKMSSDQYTSLAKRSVRMPLEFASSSAEVISDELNKVVPPADPNENTLEFDSASTAGIVANPSATSTSTTSTPTEIDTATSTGDAPTVNSDTNIASSTTISTSTNQTNIAAGNPTQRTSSDAVMPNEDASVTGSSAPQ